MNKTLPAKPLLRSELVNTVAGQALAKVARGRHLEPGVVAYDNEDGSKTTYLLTREAIAAMRPTMKGVPVVGKSGGFDHLKVNARDQAAGKYDGEVVESYDGGDGWDYALFQISNQETIDACADGYKLSCAYVPDDVEEKPGVWHNVPYDAVIRNGHYTHLAVVPNPRYEGADIELLNSNKKRGGTVKDGVIKSKLKALLNALMPFPELKEVVNSIEEDKKRLEEHKNAKRAEAKNAYDAGMKAAGEDEAKKKEAQEAFEQANAAIDALAEAPEESAEDKAKREKQEKLQALRNEADALEKELAAPADKPLGGGDVTPEPGVPGTPGATAPSKKPEAPNAGAAPAGESEAEKAEREKRAQEAKNAEDAAKAKAEEEARKKREEEHQNALKKIEAEAKKTAEAAAHRRERFNALRAAADERGGSTGSPFVGITTLEEKAILGRARYGSK